MTEKRSHRDAYLRRTYNLSQEKYDEILAGQGGGCALCGKTPEDEGQALAVDHDHKTYVVRGILCRYCNHRVVGRHRDAGLLLKLAEYVTRDVGITAPGNVKKRRRRTTRKAK